MKADEVRDVRFLSGGYDASQVEELLRRIAAELDAGRTAGPLIADAAFRRARAGQAGYETDAADWFLYQLLRQEDHDELTPMSADPWRDLAMGNYFTRSGPGDLAEGTAAPSWRAVRGYDSGWNGLTGWDHIGYPGDLGGGTRPSFQGSISIDKTIGRTSDEYLNQKADIWPGQSGGPFFDWFGSDPCPSVVGVQSAQNSSNNSAGGGNYIPSMVNQARNNFP